MAKESEFIDKLTNFTSALESLVDLLKEQQKIGPTEVVNKLLENIDGEAIASIAKNIEEVKANTVEINKNTEKILKVVQDSKKAKETGMFGETNDRKNKQKIIDGVKTVILIAGGVLAIGLAFKIIGHVDFFSVVALGMGIMFVAFAFSKIAALRDDKGNIITMKQIVMGAVALVIMSAAVLVAGLILKRIPILGLGELITIAFIGLSMGIATYFILKAVGHLTMKQLLMAPLVPLVLPAVALGVVLSGVILQQMPEVGFKQILSAFLVSIALVPMAVAFGFMMKGLKNAKTTDIFFVALAIPAIAAGIVVASWILQLTSDIPLFAVIKAGIGIGIATLAMIPTLWLLKKAGLLNPSSIKDLAIGVLAVTLISLAIVAASWIFSIGKFDGPYPSAEWALGVGLSIILFTIPVAVIGVMVATGVGFVALAAGLLGIPLIALAIASTSWILSMGTYKNFPPFEWSASVGLSMLVFGVPIVTLGAFILGSFGLGLLALAAGVDAVLMIADSLVKADVILSKGKWGNYPSSEWAGGVGESIKAFSGVLIQLTAMQMLSDMFSFFFGGGTQIDLPSFIVTVSTALLSAGKIFNSAPNVFGGNYPTEAWAKGVGTSIRAFSEVLIEITKLQMLEDMMSFFSFGLFGGSKIDLPAFIKSTAEGLIVAGKIFSTAPDVFEGNYPSEKWAKGVGGSIKAFAEAMSALSDADVDIDASDLYDDDGAVAIMLGLSVGIVAVGNYFNKYGIKFNMDKIPSEDWAKGVGGSIKAFAEAIKALDDAGVDLDADDLYEDDGAIAIMLGLSVGLVAIGNYFNKFGGKFDVNKVPSSEWSDAVSGAIESFSKMSENVDEENFYKLPTIGKMMYIFASYMAIILKKYANVFQGEDGGITGKISKSIKTIMEVLPKQNEIDPMWSLIDALNALAEVDWDELSNIGNISSLIGQLTNQMDKLNESKIDSLARLSAGLQIMTLIDESKLQSVLDTIEDKSEALSEIMDDGSFIRSIFDGVAQSIVNQRQSGPTSMQNATVAKPEVEGKEKKSFEDKLLEYVKNIDTNIGKMATFGEEEKTERMKAKDVDDGEDSGLFHSSYSR